MKYKDFSLIEIMIVIAIIGMTLAIMIPACSNTQQGAITVDGDGNEVAYIGGDTDRVQAEGYYVTRHEYPEDGVVCYVTRSKYYSDYQSIACVDVTP